ncbi:hypothetical protein RUM43_001165 [Polyplax serrata]|uniref:Uncharacterized protein n=1 Tax=Polyplax serrata TaxID=468196 RepID=A0AAN8XPS8_POLSC
MHLRSTARVPHVRHYKFVKQQDGSREGDLTKIYPRKKKLHEETENPQQEITDNDSTIRETINGGGTTRGCEDCKGDSNQISRHSDCSSTSVAKVWRIQKRRTHVRQLTKRGPEQEEEEEEEESFFSQNQRLSLL